MQRQTIGRRATSKIVKIPEEVAAIILNPKTEPVGFSDIKTAVVSQRNRRGRSHPELRMVGAHQECCARNQCRAAFAFHPFQFRIVRTRHALWRKDRMRIRRKHEMIGSDNAPIPSFIVHNPNNSFPSHKLRDVPNHLTQNCAVFAGRLTDHFPSHL